MRKNIPAQTVLVCDRCLIESEPFTASTKHSVSKFSAHEMIELTVECAPMDLCDDCARAVRDFANTNPTRIREIAASAQAALDQVKPAAGYEYVLTNNPCL